MHSTIALMIVGCVVAGLFFLVDRVPDEAPKRVSPLPAITPPVLSEQQPVLNRPQKRAQETSIVEPIPENQNPAVEIPDEPAEDLDWESRGAKLKKGRKLTEKASLLMQQGRYTDASVILTDALRVFPEKTKDLSYGEALYKLGICLRRKGQPAQAIPVLREAMRFPYYRTKVLREVEAATSQIKRAKVSQTGGGTR